MTELLKPSELHKLNEICRLIDEAYDDKMQNLRGELAVAKAERDRLLADINCFMKDFAEGATIINSAVEAWNATVPE